MQTSKIKLQSKKYIYYSYSVVTDWINANKLVVVILLSIFVLAFVLRISGLDQNLLFGFEQGRDALKAQDIHSFRDIVLIGPKTDIDGIFHGVWYYYLVAILYLVSQGDPVLVVYELAALNALSVFVVYAIARNLNMSKPMSVIASLFVAVSFNIVIYARWLSNVSPSILVVACFMLSVILLVKNRKDIYWIPTFFFFALLFHFELLHGLYATVLLLVISPVYRLKLFTKNWWIGLGLFVAINIPFVIFDIKNQFILSKGVIHYLTTSNLSPKPFHAITVYTLGLIQEITTTFHTKMATAPFLAFFVLLIKILTDHKSRSQSSVQVLLFFIAWSFPYMFLLKYDPLDQFYAGTSLALILVFTYGLSIITTNSNKYFVYGASILLSLGMFAGTYENIASREGIFYHSVQRSMTLGDQKKVISQMFSKNTPFEWEAFTIPYYYNDAYKYLIPWYGNKLVGSNAQSLLSAPDKELYFLIIEPSTSGYWLDRWIKEKDGVSTKVKESEYGEMLLEERLKK